MINIENKTLVQQKTHFIFRVPALVPKYLCCCFITFAHFIQANMLFKNLPPQRLDDHPDLKQPSYRNY